MKLILGDAIERMRELPSGTIDAVICDLARRRIEHWAAEGDASDDADDGQLPLPLEPA